MSAVHEPVLFSLLWHYRWHQLYSTGVTNVFFRRVSDIEVCPDTGSVVSVSCGDESFPCDAVVSAVGINGVKGIVRAAPALSKFPFFSKMMNLRWVQVQHGVGLTPQIPIVHATKRYGSPQMGHSMHPPVSSSFVGLWASRPTIQGMPKFSLQNFVRQTLQKQAIYHSSFLRRFTVHVTFH